MSLCYTETLPTYLLECMYECLQWKQYFLTWKYYSLRKKGCYSYKFTFRVPQSDTTSPVPCLLKRVPLVRRLPDIHVVSCVQIPGSGRPSAEGWRWTSGPASDAASDSGPSVGGSTNTWRGSTAPPRRRRQIPCQHTRSRNPSSGSPVIDDIKNLSRVF